MLSKAHYWIGTKQQDIFQIKKSEVNRQVGTVDIAVLAGSSRMAG